MAEYLAENSRLRQLSRRYADGQLGLEDYRSARREILEALEAGKLQAATEAESDAALGVTDPAGFAATNVHLPDDSAVFYKTMPPRATVHAAELASSAAVPTLDSHTRILAIVLGVALLIALAALVYVFFL